MVKMERGADFRGSRMTLTEGLRAMYSKVEQATKGTVRNEYSTELESRFSSLFIKYNLSLFQASTARSLFEEFDRISHAIDPEKLSFKEGVNPDDDLVLYRRSSKGLINLVIHDEELITYSFVSYTDSTQDMLIYIGEEDRPFDFESIAYKFLVK